MLSSVKIKYIFFLIYIFEKDECSKFLKLIRFQKTLNYGHNFFLFGGANEIEKCVMMIKNFFWEILVRK